jgi:predicted nuclease of predicted toxin-antitoxin system
VLSLRLLLDEDSQAQLLVKLLTAAGHDVLTINEIGLAGCTDNVVLDYAIQENRILLTHNCDDFEELHQANPNHSGIFAVYRNANLLKNMGFKAIVKAIANLETANVPLANQFISLNHWNY